MARDYAKTNLTIWQDPEWRALPWPAQHVYKMFWEHPGLSYCGVVDWRPAKMLGWGEGWTRDDLELLTDCLRARHFLVVDEDTEECLVRSWVRFDGIIKQPRLTVSMCNAFGEVGSNDLRGVVVDELRKLHEREPEAAGWAKSQTKDILRFPAVSAKDLPVPEDPFRSGFGVSLGMGLGSVSAPVSEAFGPNPTSGFGTGLGTPYNSNSTITTTPLHPAANEPGDEEQATPSPPAKQPKRGKQLPTDFKPSEKHLEMASELGVDLRAEWGQFCDHHRAKGSTMKDWDAALRTWIRNAKRFSRQPDQGAGDWMRRRPS